MVPRENLMDAPGRTIATMAVWGYVIRKTKRVEMEERS
jgi:hypothetical protein